VSSISQENVNALIVELTYEDDTKSHSNINSNLEKNNDTAKKYMLLKKQSKKSS
jgi:hypothetical protein